MSKLWKIKNKYRFQKKKKLTFYIFLYNYIKRLSTQGFVVNVHVSYSNILISFTKGTGDLLFCFAQGMLRDKYLKKGSAYAAQKVGYVFGKKVFSKCYFPLILKIYSKINHVMEATVTGLFDAKLIFRYYLLVPIVQFNGCRHKLKKRKKRRTKRRKN